MKKLALLLAALSVASVSYAKEVMPVAEPVVEEEVVVEAPVVEVKAAPVLRVTSVGQYIEVDNTSSANGKNAEDIGEAVHFGNKVGLALGDNWTFDLMARKTWSADTDDGMKSNGHRIELGATRHFENFTLGVKWRGEKDLDRFYLPVSYNYGMLSGWATPAYTFVNEANSKAEDYFYLEAEPVVLSYGPVQLAYYFEGFKYAGDGCAVEDKKSDYSHQVRLRGTVYSNDTVTLGAEYRYQFAQDVEMLNGKDGLENNRHIAIVSAAYNVTENLVVDTYYEYDFNKYEAHDAAAKDDDYYGEFGLGWTYNF